MTSGTLLLAFLTLQRVSELVIASSNTAALLRDGAHEHGAGHYPVMVLLHATWLATLWFFGWNHAASLPFVAAFVLLQGARLWVLLTLGKRWTTRIIVAPNVAPITSGPYRLVRHPNYVVVVLEIPCVSLAMGLLWHAALFGALNIAMLWWRIRTEDRACAGSGLLVEPQKAESPLARSWFGFTAMCLGLFMAILDIQIVAAALPRIATALHTPLDELSWVQTAYLITEIIAIALSGRLARALSTHWLFASASLGFVLTSLGCALSHGFIMLIIWRTLQGFFAGVITPTVFAAGYKMFPKQLQARAILIAGALAMLAPSIGPFLGGYVAEKLTWNWLFFINIPIGLAVTAVVATTVRIDGADRRPGVLSIRSRLSRSP